MQFDPPKSLSMDFSFLLNVPLVFDSEDTEVSLNKHFEGIDNSGYTQEEEAELKRATNLILSAHMAIDDVVNFQVATAEIDCLIVCNGKAYLEIAIWDYLNLIDADSYIQHIFKNHIKNRIAYRRHIRADYSPSIKRHILKSEMIIDHLLSKYDEQELISLAREVREIYYRDDSIS